MLFDHIYLNALSKSYNFSIKMISKPLLKKNLRSEQSRLDKKIKTLQNKHYHEARKDKKQNLYRYILRVPEYLEKLKPREDDPSYNQWVTIHELTKKQVQSINSPFVMPYSQEDDSKLKRWRKRKGECSKGKSKTQIKPGNNGELNSLHQQSEDVNELQRSRGTIFRKKRLKIPQKFNNLTTEDLEEIVIKQRLDGTNIQIREAQPIIQKKSDKIQIEGTNSLCNQSPFLFDFNFLQQEFVQGGRELQSLQYGEKEVQSHEDPNIKSEVFLYEDNVVTKYLITGTFNQILQSSEYQGQFLL